MRIQRLELRKAATQRDALEVSMLVSSLSLQCRLCAGANESTREPGGGLRIEGTAD